MLLYEEASKRSPSLVPREGTEKTAAYGQGGRFSPDTESAGAWTLDLPAPEGRRVNVLFLTPQPTTPLDQREGTNTARC